MYAKHLKLDITAILFSLIVFATHAGAVTVSVDAPEYVSGSSFDVEIGIDDVDDLDSGQFDLSFNSSVVNVTDLDDDIENGEIEDTTIPIENCYFMDSDTIRLLFNLPGVSGVSGGGSLARIRFEVVGRDGDSSFLNLSDGVLVDKESDKIPADWVSGRVTIGDPSVGATEEHTVTVYVKNIDDDRLDVHLLVDGNDEGFESISSGKTKEYDDYKLEDGVHTFTIRWFDTDTDEWYEKTEEHTITDVATIVLLTEDHSEDEDKISAHVYVKNLDDNDLDVYLYIDGDYKKYANVSSSGTEDYGEYEFEEDEEPLHAFKIEWFDPGTGEEYEKIVRSYITSEEAVTLYVDMHREEDIVVLPDETPAPVQTTSTPAQALSRSTNESQPTLTTTHVSPASSDDPTGIFGASFAGGGNFSLTPSEYTGCNDLGHSIISIYTLVGLIAILFALIQIRRI